MIRFLDKDWSREWESALESRHNEIRIVAPFIKLPSVDRILRKQPKSSIRVLTRFSLADFVSGVSDVTALQRFLDVGAHVRGVRHLHAKLFVFGSSQAIVTSANLTEAALFRNHEFGVISNEASFVEACTKYFDKVWREAAPDVLESTLQGWQDRIDAIRLTGAQRFTLPPLEDFGADLGLQPGPTASSGTAAIESASRSFVKLFGESEDRMPRDFPVLNEVKRAGCHWACGYPKKGRPRQPEDGDIVLMGRLVKKPDDTLIFGRAKMLRHVRDRDDASPAEIRQRRWKSKWPYYVRVYDAEFLNGTLSNGVSLKEMMKALGSESFATTSENAAKGAGNTDPHASLRQQPAVRLTADAFVWLNSRFENALLECGRIGDEVMSKLDWPTVPGVPQLKRPANGER